MNTENFPPIAHRLMRASLKAPVLNFFWGLSLGFIVMVFPNLWVQVVGGLLYLFAFVWFTLCLLAKRDLQPDEPKKGFTAAELQAELRANARKLEKKHGLEEGTLFNHAELPQGWKRHGLFVQRDPPGGVAEVALTDRCHNLVSHSIPDVGGVCAWCGKTEASIVEAAMKETDHLLVHRMERAT